MKRSLAIAITLVAALGLAARAQAHCQIPCGIYHDELRVQLIEEHIETISKSMRSIVDLAKDPTANANQLIRWVTNKEDHAQQIQDIVTAYFMAQRVKWADPSDEAAHAAYVHQLVLLHQLQVHAMKAKQSTDLGEVETLRSLVKDFRKAYFGDDGGHSH